MDEDLVKLHYSNKKVQEEIALFSQSRWVGLHCMEKDRNGRPYLVRYLSRAKIPLRITDPSDVPKLLKIFSKLKPRTFYATANVYAKVSKPEHLTDSSNIRACMPTWDIDNVPEKWEATISAAREIISFLERNGIKRSTYAVWSGKGCHIRIHHEAISPEVRRRILPLDAAYAIVEYVNSKLHGKFTEISLRRRADLLRVDNEMDQQRLFTSPLSLHKELDMVCVCVSPNDLDRFNPSWATPKKYKHYKNWNRFSIGEADELTLKAYESIGKYPAVSRVQAKKHPAPDEQITRWLMKVSKE